MLQDNEYLFYERCDSSYLKGDYKLANNSKIKSFFVSNH